MPRRWNPVDGSPPGAPAPPKKPAPAQPDTASKPDTNRKPDTTTVEPRPSRLPTEKVAPPPRPASAIRDSRPATTGDPLTLGSQLDRYLLRQKLGQGGMGVVYRAYDPKLDRNVALKVLHPQRLQPRGRDRAKNARRAEQARQRLLREAWALARLTHPNVVTVYDIGSHGDQVFLAMELIEGETLSTWSRRQRASGHSPPWRQVLQLLRQAGEGLAAAHESGLVHRDFKPSNVLIDGAGRVRVLDFGLARTAAPRAETVTDLLDADGNPHPDAQPRAASSAPGSKGRSRASRDADRSGTASSVSPDDTLTQPGALIGTPAYMAPEQLHGQSTDARGDQYSFCVSLYQLLYGELPPDPASLAAARSDAKDPEPHRPGTRLEDWQWPWHRPPLWLFRALLRGLDPDPAHRYPDMRSLLAALHPRRHDLRRLAQAAAVALLLSTGIWLLLDERAPIDVNTTRSEQHFGQAREYLQAGNDNLALTSLGLALHHAGLAGNVELQARSLLLQAQLQSQTLSMNAEAHDDALASLHKARDVARRTTESQSLQLDRFFVASQVHYLAGNFDVAEEIARRALRLSEIWNGHEHPSTARQLSALALIERDLDPQQAREAFREALKIREATLGPDHPQTLRSRINLAHVLLELGQRGEAKVLLERALPQLEGSSLTKRPSQELNAVHALLADLLTREGNAKSAFQLRRLELAGRIRLSGEDSYDASRGRNNMGGTLLALGRPADALPLLQQALATQEAERGDSDISLLYVLINLSRAQHQAGDAAGAERTSERALEILRATGLPPGHSLYQQLLTSGPEPAEADVEAMWESLLPGT